MKITGIKPATDNKEIDRLMAAASKLFYGENYLTVTSTCLNLLAFSIAIGAEDVEDAVRVARLVGEQLPDMIRNTMQPKPKGH